jgi:hypothetical protein
VAIQYKYLLCLFEQSQANNGMIFLYQLQTFDLDAPHRTLEEISDGVAMAQALNQM